MNSPVRKPNSVSCANGPPYVASGRIVGHSEVGQFSDGRAGLVPKVVSALSGLPRT
jgi:hypothetical protein